MRTSALFTFCTVAAVAVLSVSCKQDPPAPIPTTTTGVFVVNSGVEVNGTGSLSIYEPKQKTIEHNVFYKKNTYPPGNLMNSMLVEEDRIFLVMNGVGSVRVVNPSTLELEKNIKNMIGPRYIKKVGRDKYYVTDWGSQGAWVVYINSKQAPFLVPTGIAPEHMAVYKDMVFVANSGGAFSDSTLTIIHAVEDTVMATIKVGHNPNSLVVDKEGILWVLCSGIEDAQNPFNSTQGSLVSYDLTRDSLEYNIKDSLIVRDSLVFVDNQLKPTNLTLSADGTTLYFLDNDLEADLWRYTIGSLSLPTSSYIPGNFNSIGYDPIEKEIYLSDPGNGKNVGHVARYQESGGQVDLFEVGVNPVNFGFK